MKPIGPAAAVTAPTASTMTTAKLRFSRSTFSRE
jgi:hypothetical protein